MQEVLSRSRSRQRCGGFRFGIRLTRHAQVTQVGRWYFIPAFSSMKVLSFWSPAVQPWRGFSHTSLSRHQSSTSPQDPDHVIRYVDSHNSQTSIEVGSWTTRHPAFPSPAPMLPPRHGPRQPVGDESTEPEIWLVAESLGFGFREQSFFRARLRRHHPGHAVIDHKLSIVLAGMLDKAPGEVGESDLLVGEWIDA